MATIALAIVGGLVGSAIGGTVAMIGTFALTSAMVGAMVGGMIGQVIDTQLIFKPQDGPSGRTTGGGLTNTDGQRLNDIMLMSGAEGTGMYECHGIANKIAAQCIYVSNIRERAETTALQCFIAETPVDMADGTTKAIKDIQIGDKVRSCKVVRTEDTDEFEYEIVDGEVTDTFKNDNPEHLYRLVDTRTIEYYITAGHPVFADGEWKMVSDLEPGMKLLYDNDNFEQDVYVESVKPASSDKANGAVYNFSVKDYENYFVWSTLFHNSKSGGGGGGGDTVVQPVQLQTRYYYSADLGIAACDATNGKNINTQYAADAGDRGRASGIRKIWFNNKKVYDSYVFRGSPGEPPHPFTTGRNMSVSWIVNYVDAYTYQVASFDVTYIENNEDKALDFEGAGQGDGHCFIASQPGTWPVYYGSTTGNNFTLSGEGYAGGEVMNRAENLITIRMNMQGVVLYGPQSPYWYMQQANPDFDPFDPDETEPPQITIDNHAARNLWDTLRPDGHKFATDAVPDDPWNANLWTGCSQFGASIDFTNIDVRWSQTVGPLKTGTMEADGTILIYDGSQASENPAMNTPNPDLVATYGAGNVPLFKNTVWVMFKNIALGDFGNSIPQCMFEVNASKGTDYADIKCDEGLRRVFKDSGWTEGTESSAGSRVFNLDGIDTSAAKNKLFGFCTEGVMSLESRIKCLILMYDLRVRVEDDVLKIYEASATGANYEVAASADELGCLSPEESPQAPLRVSDSVGWRLPSQVNLSFYDVNKEGQTGSVVATKALSVFADVHEHVKTIDIPAHWTVSLAKKRANQLLWEAEQLRQSVSLRLPPSAVEKMILPNDILTVTNSAGEDFKVRVLEVNRGDNFLHEITGILEEAKFSDFAEDGDEHNGTTPPDNYVPPTMSVLPFIETAIDTLGTTTPSFYFGGSCYPNTAFQGATAVASGDGVTWSVVGEYTGQQAATGFLLPNSGTPNDVLGTWAHPSTIDTVNTATVKLADGSTLSSSDNLIAMLNGQNRIVIGQELIGYQTATEAPSGSPDALGMRTYALTNLWRNLRGQVGDSDNLMTHSQMESVLLLQNKDTVQSIAKFRGPPESIGNTIYYKIVADEGEIANAGGGQILFEGNSVRCLSPCNVTFHRFATGCDNTSYGCDTNLPPVNFAQHDMIVRFVRRGRALKNVFSTTGMPEFPTSTKFRLEVVSGTGNTYVVHRTLVHDSTGIEGTNYPLYDGKFQIVYTKVQQDIDLDDTDPLRVKIHQVGTTVDRGFEADVTG